VNHAGEARSLAGALISLIFREQAHSPPSLLPIF
jgi:hypothetical protein